MQQDEDGLSNPLSHQILFNVKQKQKSIFPISRWKSAFEIQMVFHDPLPLGYRGLSEIVFISDQNGRFKAWV